MVTQLVVTPPSRAAIFLVVTVDEGAQAQVPALLEEIPGLTRSVGFRAPEQQLICNVGIGSDLWDRAFAAAPRPKHLHPFAEIRGARHVAPATPGDLLLHIRAGSPDLCFALARHVVDRLDGVGTVVDEVHGFTFFDQRDLLGFVDGTENPEGDDATSAALIGEEDPDYAGGSYVIVQKYLHDLGAWGEMSVEEQERAIGRTKAEDIELDDATKPADSHVALATIEEPDGTQRQIYRENMPFGRVGDGEYGTYFIGYAADPGVTEQMLRRMFVGEPEGSTDRILEVSTAHTGSLYVVPPSAWLSEATAHA